MDGSVISVARLDHTLVCDERTTTLDTDASLRVLQETVTQTTEIVLVSGDRYRVSGDLSDIERVILDAARGAIMEFAWVLDAETGERLAINPECVALLRVVRS